MKVKVSARSFIYLQIIYNFVIKFFITDLHFPSLLNYGTDAINLLLFFLVIKHDGFVLVKRTAFPLRVALLLLLEGSISFLLDFSSPLLFVWSLRNIYRFFIFFYCCIRTLDMTDVPKVFNICEKALIINGILCIYEYFARGIKYDFLGGLFGNGVTGGNGPLNALMVVVCAYVIVEYVNKNKKLGELLIIVGTCLFISVIGELKFFFFELIFIVIFTFTFVTKNFKMLVFTFVAFVAGVFAVNLYVKLYPNNAGFLSLSFIQDYAFERTYGSSTDINRLTAIQYIQDNFFKGNIKRNLLGLGMGNGETAQYSFLTSDFYSLYGSRVKYNWFSHAFMYVENGIIGLVLYFSFFALIFIKAFLKRKNDKWMQLCSLLTLEVIILVVYNQTLRVESMGYMLFLVLAMPYLKSGVQEVMR